MKKSNGYYLFSLNNEHYLYDLNGNIIIEINESLYETLEKYHNGQECTHTDMNILNAFLANGLLRDFDSQPKPDTIETEVAYLSFAPTYKCNFRCSYCFGDHGDKYKGDKREFTQNSVIQMLNYFFYTAFPDAKQYRVDFVSGGEPLLGLRIVKTAIEHIEKYKNISGKRVSIWLCTNASLLTNNIIEYLSLHNVSIGISIDGRKEYNDANRIDIHGNGTYDQICKGLDLIKHNERVSKKFKNIWGLCTATNDNCDFVDILFHMRELGFRNVQIRLIRSKENYNLDKIVFQYSRLVYMLFDMYSKGDLRCLRMILNENDQFGKVLKRIMLDRILIRRCNAGVNKITICPDGTIYPCDSFVGLSDFALGNMNDNFWNRLQYKNMTVNTIEPCRSCDIKYLCGGDCYYNSLMKTGYQFSPDMEFCQIQKHIMHEAVVLRYKMQKLDNELYNTLLKEEKRRDDYAKFFG